MTIFLNFLVYLENFPASNIDINDTLSSEYFTIFLAFLLYWLRFQHHKIVINCLHQVFVTSVGMLLKQRDRQREKERDPSKYLCICLYMYVCILTHMYEMLKELFFSSFLKYFINHGCWTKLGTFGGYLLI